MIPSISEDAPFSGTKRKKRAVRTCTRCPTELAGNGKYCPPCSDIVASERAKLKKRKARANSR